MPDSMLWFSLCGKSLQARYPIQVQLFSKVKKLSLILWILPIRLLLEAQEQARLVFWSVQFFWSVQIKKGLYMWLPLVVAHKPAMWGLNCLVLQMANAECVFVVQSYSHFLSIIPTPAMVCFRWWMWHGEIWPACCRGLLLGCWFMQHPCLFYAA